MTPSFPVFSPSPVPRRGLLTEIGRLWAATCVCILIAFASFAAGYAKAERDLDPAMRAYSECAVERAHVRETAGRCAHALEQCAENLMRGGQ